MNDNPSSVVGIVAIVVVLVLVVLGVFWWANMRQVQDLNVDVEAPVETPDTYTPPMPDTTDVDVNVPITSTTNATSTSTTTK